MSDKYHAVWYFGFKQQALFNTMSTSYHLSNLYFTPRPPVNYDPRHPQFGQEDIFSMLRHLEFKFEEVVLSITDLQVGLKAHQRLPSWAQPDTYFRFTDSVPNQWNSSWFHAAPIGSKPVNSFYDPTGSRRLTLVEEFPMSGDLKLCTIIPAFRYYPGIMQGHIFLPYGYIWDNQYSGSTGIIHEVPTFNEAVLWLDQQPTKKNWRDPLAYWNHMPTVS